MPQNALSIHQFRALRWLDEFFGTDDSAERNRRYGAALDRLDDAAFDVLGQTVAGVQQITQQSAPDPLDHLDRHWLSGSYFPGVDATVVRRSLQDGYRSAIADAQNAGLPLHSVWVCGTEDSSSSDFRVDHVVGPTAVTVAIITPRPQA